MQAMMRGDFYASSGVVLNDVSFEKGTLTLEIAERDGVSFSTSFIGTRKAEGSVPGEVLATVEGLNPSYAVTGEEMYVRAVVNSSQSHPNPSFKDQKEQAWTQPVGWR